MKFTQSGGQSAVGPEAWFTGTVYLEPNEEHWHGATADRFMAHVAIQEADDQGQVVTWGGHVTGQEYRQPCTTTN
jgi:hypothetical protein